MHHNSDTKAVFQPSVVCRTCSTRIQFNNTHQKNQHSVLQTLLWFQGQWQCQSNTRRQEYQQSYQTVQRTIPKVGDIKARLSNAKASSKMNLKSEF